MGFRPSVVSTWMKHFANILLACALLSLTVPLMVFIALAIKCESPGPVLQRRERVGFGGRRVALLAFRTTVYDPAEALPAWARKPTRVGAFLWQTRMNALPQLINALRGEMSLLEAEGWPGSSWD
jgi:lipopolysaccharide/colanic/teichoic acid biosynthesis glycosyltransferase